MEIDKRNKLEKRTIDILNKTKNNQTRYSTIRKKLYGFYENGTNLAEWENYLNEVENMLEI